MPVQLGDFVTVDCPVQEDHFYIEWYVTPYDESYERTILHRSIPPMYTAPGYRVNNPIFSDVSRLTIENIQGYQLADYRLEQHTL